MEIGQRFMKTEFFGKRSPDTFTSILFFCPRENSHPSALTEVPLFYQKYQQNPKGMTSENGMLKKCDVRLCTLTETSNVRRKCIAMEKPDSVSRPLLFAETQ
jgi:hypothetical protein